MGYNRCTDRPVIEIDDTGDSKLCAYELKLWSLFYDVLERFYCPIVFSSYGPDCTRKMNQIIDIFVPKSHDKCAEACEFIREELKDEIRLPEIDEQGNWFWGTEVHVHTFSGVIPYVTREDMRPIIEEAAKRLQEMFLKREKGLH